MTPRTRVTSSTKNTFYCSHLRDEPRRIYSSSLRLEEAFAAAFYFFGKHTGTDMWAFVFFFWCIHRHTDICPWVRLVHARARLCTHAREHSSCPILLLLFTYRRRWKIDPKTQCLSFHWQLDTERFKRYFLQETDTEYAVFCWKWTPNIFHRHNIYIFTENNETHSVTDLLIQGPKHIGKDRGWHRHRERETLETQR